MKTPNRTLLQSVCVAGFALGVMESGLAAENNLAGWFPFSPRNVVGPSVIGMEDWLERPAGRHGRIVREDSRLVYDGKPIKLWGLNLCYSACAPNRKLADRRAAFYAKFGVNSVRLHKFVDGPGWAGIQSVDSCVEFDPETLDRMDYQVAKLKEAGIYVTLSAHFGALKLGPADREYVPFLDEFGQLDASKQKRVSTPHSAIHYSPELQAVQIRQMVNLLKHRNPHTGLTYAEDPAVAFLEIINEQSILFYTSMGPLKASPTLRRQVAGRFCDWLRAKYGSQAGLKTAWGRRAFGGWENEGLATRGESLDARNILPLGNPWYWEPAQLDGSQAYRKQRLLDTLQFLYELQNQFYDRYVQAVREAGYTGEIVASNWQAGNACSHYANLHSDWRVGTIDRHNYFGGGKARPGEKFNNATMLNQAGSGTLSVGLQQVHNRPFMLSEWIHVFPNEWGVEGPSLVGAYGCGLQGWDVSYMFQNGDSGGFSDQIGREAWDVTAPQVLGVFPAVARQVLRGDVRESELRASLYVHLPSLVQGKTGFIDRTAQQRDVKSFQTDKVAARTLAVVRCAVEFTDSWMETPKFHLEPFQKDGFLISSTRQLRWKENGDDRLAGFFTVDTPGTKAVVGFANGQACRLGAVAILPQSRFCAIYITAPKKNETITSSESLLVVALARARNTGMELSPAENEVRQRGQSPILLEPVRAQISITGRPVRQVTILDHDGQRTTATRPVRDGRFTIDGRQDRAIYYEID